MAKYLTYLTCYPYMLILPANNQEERSRYTAVYISGYDEIYLSINMQLNVTNITEQKWN